MRPGARRRDRHMSARVWRVRRSPSHTSTSMLSAHRSRSFARKLASPFAVLVAGVVLSAGSCTVIVGPETEEPGSIFELRVRWAQWRAVGPDDYSFELRRTCFCIPDAVTPARVEVRDGVVVDARALDDGRALPLQFFDPIDTLFADAIEAAERGEPVEASYHRTLSYPTRLEIGTLANDAGVRYEVSRLVALP
jgi:hypothetical protein